MKRKPKDSWSLYVAECSDGSYYTGIAKDVAKRIEVHNSGKGAKYTSTHLPVKLLFQEPQKDYSAALKREYQVKRLPKARKVRFAAGEPLLRPKKKAKMSFQRKRKLTTKARRHEGRRKKIKRRQRF